jgi:hypothetical protein
MDSIQGEPMTAQRTAGPYSVVNGKLFRDGATARIEVKPSEARDMLNSLLRQRDELAAALIDLMAEPNETRTAGIDNTEVWLVAGIDLAALDAIDTQVKP